MADLVELLSAPGAASADAGDAVRGGRASRRRLGTHLSETAAELFALPSRADAPDAAAAFGVTRTTLADGLRAVAQRTAAVER